ncbi:MAG: class C sortase [Hornefia sp.]|nr:class C sortase [Hornefia sp.]
MNEGRTTRRKNKKNLITKMLILIVFAVGLILLMYPVASDMHNLWKNEKNRERYLEKVRTNSEKENNALWKEAEKYNENHVLNSVKDVFCDDKNFSEDSRKYRNTLNPNGDEMMCYVEIPGANISLAVFHGATKNVLEKGVAHIEGTSLPVGGKGSHAVLAAHRGLPFAKLFTDLDSVQEGDRFYIHVLSKTLAYKIDRIKVVTPEDVSMYFSIDKNKDYVTLMTCTPYGVNTHRLLIRGHRVAAGSHREAKPLMSYIIYTVVFATIVLVIIYVYKKRKNRSK